MTIGQNDLRQNFRCWFAASEDGERQEIGKVTRMEITFDDQLNAIALTEGHLGVVEAEHIIGKKKDGPT